MNYRLPDECCYNCVNSYIGSYDDCCCRKLKAVEIDKGGICDLYTKDEEYVPPLKIEEIKSIIELIEPVKNCINCKHSIEGPMCTIDDSTIEDIASCCAAWEYA